MASPPLFRLSQNGHYAYALDTEERDEFIRDGIGGKGRTGTARQTISSSGSRLQYPSGLTSMPTVPMPNHHPQASFSSSFMWPGSS